MIAVALAGSVACSTPSDEGKPSSDGRGDVVVAAAQSANLTVTETPAWHLAWRAETVLPGVTTATSTCRFSTRLTSARTSVRVEFSSPAEGAGYRLLGGSVARPLGRGSLDVAEPTSLPLTFSGSPSVKVRGLGTVASDPLPMTVAANSDLLVTVTASAGDAYSKGTTTDPGACSAGPVTNPATASAQALSSGPPFVRWLRSVQVEGVPVRSVVALGDSLTEGPRGAAGYQRWSDLLVRPGVAFANAGVFGNALSRQGLFGTQDGVSRARALLKEPNVNDVVLLLGTNDLSFFRSSEQILASMEEVASAAADAGVRLWVATLLPRGAPIGDRTERNRLEVNDGLRDKRFANKGVRVIDTSAALADPTTPTRLRPACDFGDGVHLNAEGTRVLSESIGQALGLTV